MLGLAVKVPLAVAAMKEVLVGVPLRKLTMISPLIIASPCTIIWSKSVQGLPSASSISRVPLLVYPLLKVRQSGEVPGETVPRVGLMKLVLKMPEPFVMPLFVKVPLLVIVPLFVNVPSFTRVPSICN